ncbi:MAG: MBL fold metallo-hydrolase [Candidatus Krumholzibacteriota bacterium]|nr:MBL fold metallo-hydrolase [Candidatus Krumholzibacteriota bacterium]
MLLKHYFIGKIAHSSYILAGKEICAVIDPQRDVDFYIDEARLLGVDITHILETHLHADFISGHIDLAERTGAKIYAPKSGKCRFDHVGLSEGDIIELEDMELKVLETPGHTPEHISYVVTDKSRGDGPLGVFTGDTLFVGDVGRPDLFPDIAEELAGKLFHSLHEKLMRLPDYCEVYPAHGAGSLCGRAMGAKWRTTIGYERLYNAALQIVDKSDFVRSLTTDMPPAPDHFSRCSDINRQGPAMISELPVLRELDPAQFHKKMQDPGIIVLDARSYDSFGSQHIPGSWHIDFGGNFPTFAGWVLPTDKNILLVAASYSEAVHANTWARRVGVDRIVGYLNGSMFAWAVAGLRTSDLHLISAEDLHDMATGTSNIVLLDVRSPREFEDNHIEGAVNIPAPELRTRFRELHPEKPTVLICSTGHRSSLGASILGQKGFKSIYNVAGGMTGYSAAGHTKRCGVCENPHGSRFFTGYMGTSQHWNVPK